MSRVLWGLFAIASVYLPWYPLHAILESQSNPWWEVPTGLLLLLSMTAGLLFGGVKAMEDLL